MYVLTKTRHCDVWNKNGKYHRIKGPTILYCNGNLEWFFEGLLHREGNLPAVSFNGRQDFFLNGQKYLLQENGTKEFIDSAGVLHRDYGLQAVEYANGDKEWWWHGVRHREDGPAVIYGNRQFWFFNGEFIKCIL